MVKTIDDVYLICILYGYMKAIYGFHIFMNRLKI